MHKYWGKKPGSDIREILLKYTNPGDLVFDPFAGYGGVAIESVLTGRNVISNDLNPAANFINRNVLSEDVDFSRFDLMLQRISQQIHPYIKKYYTYIKNGEVKEIISILRDNNDVPLSIKVKPSSGKAQVISLNEQEKNDLIEAEQAMVIKDWFPDDHLFENPRISAKKNMRIKDLFPKRSLFFHAKLHALILNLPDSTEKDLLLFAFTANLANASRLVPPIKSRGQLSSGAWMTGFYTGKTYIENNVWHYFLNRVKRIKDGKKQFLQLIPDKDNRGRYKITNLNSKNLINFPSRSVDFIFTDFPYGDTVPYFEQSIIWNSWLKMPVDYDDEIVISNAISREHDCERFKNDIFAACKEIYRVLKTDHFFAFTFNSLSGFEWEAIVNAVISCGFQLKSLDVIVQKTFSPRQLNRKKVIQGDMLFVLVKRDVVPNVKALSKTETQNFVRKIITEALSVSSLSTNRIIQIVIQTIFKAEVTVDELSFDKLLSEIADYDSEVNEWRLV